MHIARIHQANRQDCSIGELPKPCENGDPERCATQQIHPLDTLWRGELLDTSLPTASPGYALFALTESGALRFVIQTPHMPGQEGVNLLHPLCEYVPLEQIDLV